MRNRETRLSALESKTASGEDWPRVIYLCSPADKGPGAAMVTVGPILLPEDFATQAAFEAAVCAAIEAAGL